MVPEEDVLLLFDTRVLLCDGFADVDGLANEKTA